MSNSSTKGEYLRGLKDGIPIGLGYIPVSIACGVAASKAGISALASELMTFLIYSGSGQATVTNLFEGGEVSILMYIITLFVMNCRYMLFSFSLSQRLSPTIKFHEKMLIGILNTDEVFGVAMREKGYINSKYFLGVATIPYISFILGNLTGSFATNLLPGYISSALGIMLYAMFIALIVPSAKSSKPVLWIVLIALSLSLILECIPAVKMCLSAGWIVIICAVVTSLIGAFLFPVEDSKEETISE